MSGVYEFFLTLIMIPLIFLLSLALAWIPMLAWNGSLHQMWPNIFPVIGYWQAFWLSVLIGWCVNRPRAEFKK